VHYKDELIVASTDEAVLAECITIDALFIQLGFFANLLWSELLVMSLSFAVRV
jgi:hypothetical protein